MVMAASSRQSNAEAGAITDADTTAAVDGISDTDVVWNSGGYPSQWIEIDLGTPSTLTGLRLIVAQHPAGETHHRVLGRADESGPGTLIHEFIGSTADPDELSVTLDPAIPNTRFVRIETVSSPSFVAWREVELLGRR